MKKSNKLTMFYVLSSIVLFLTLLGGGVYGVYLSAGLMFVRSNMQDFSGGNVARNVAYGGMSDSVVEAPSLGVMVLSIVLIVIAIFDFVSLVKQIVFFKQFKFVEDSNFEQSVEKKIKLKKSVVVFACVIDIVSIVVAVIGFFVNARGLAGVSSWVFYVIDGAVCLFAVMSLVLLLVKLKNVKKIHTENIEILKRKTTCETNLNDVDFDFVDKVEYFLLKLKHLKSSRVISAEEYDGIRKNFFDFENKECEVVKEKHKED